MAVRAITLAKTISWVWDQDADKGTENETKFEFRPLNGYEQAYLNDRLTMMEGGVSGDNEAEIKASIMNQKMRTEVFRVAIEAFRIACTGFTNFQDGEGKVIDYETSQATIAGRATLVLANSIIERVPPNLAIAAYKAIMEASTVSKEQEKKSGKA